ncbi:MAG: Ig domain-containing protein, partial [Terriglobia bacterium]
TVFNPAPGGGTSAAQTFTITAPVVHLTAALPDTTGGKSYDFTLGSQGGTPPITWALAATSDPLPTTLMLDSATGRISGTVDPVGVDTPFLFTVEATDSSATPQTATKALSITVRLTGPGRNDNVCPLPGTDSPTAISNGTLRASLSPYADIDVYSFQGTSANLVTIETFARRLTPESFADTVIELLDSSCTLLTFNDDIDPGIIQDSRIENFTLPSDGTFFIRVRDFRGDGRPDLIYDLSLSGAN